MERNGREGSEDRADDHPNAVTAGVCGEKGRHSLPGEQIYSSMPESFAENERVCYANGGDSKEMKVLLFLANGYEDLEATAVIETCGWTAYRENIPKVSVVIAGFGREVRGRFGTRFSTDLLIDEVKAGEYAALALPGGFDSHGYAVEAYEARLGKLLREMHERNRVILTMCVGVLPVAQAGLLVGKRATTFAFSRSEDRAARLRGLGAIVSDGPIEFDGGIISCSGPAHAIEAAQVMLAELIGADACREISKYMRGSDRAGSDSHSMVLRSGRVER